MSVCVCLCERSSCICMPRFPASCWLDSNGCLERRKLLWGGNVRQKKNQNKKPTLFKMDGSWQTDSAAQWGKVPVNCLSSAVLAL